MTHGVVINPYFDWEGDRPLGTPYNESVIYEAHVKGLTQLHPEVPEDTPWHLRRARAPGVIAHLNRLGVTAIELMPVHQFIQDSTLLDKGCATIGDTTRSGSSRRTRITPSEAGATRPAAANRSRSSSRWSRRCTPRASR